MTFGQILKESFTEAVAEVKDGVKKIFQSHLAPAIEKLTDSYVAKLKTDAANSSSFTAKLKDYGLIFVVKFCCFVISKVASKSADTVNTPNAVISGSQQ